MGSSKIKWYICVDEQKYTPEEYSEKFEKEIIEAREKQKVFFKWLSELSQILKSIEIPESRKKDLINIYEIWGSFGCTIIPSAPDNLFDNPPVDISEANQIALPHCTEEKIQKVISLICEKEFDKTYFDEAVFCYNSQKYISAASVIFAIIDSILIEFGKEQLNPKVNVGKKAIPYYEKEIAMEYKNIDDTLLTFIWHHNLLACLTKLFEYGNGFIEEPEVINRNFLLHGMMQRPVSRKDCIQLFLALYNLLDICYKFDTRIYDDDDS